jgi:hypothetical protein
MKDLIFRPIIPNKISKILKKNLIVKDFNISPLSFEIFIKAEKNLDNGFEEIEPGLYRIPWEYKSTASYDLLEFIKHDVVKYFSESDLNIISSYIKIFETGRIEPLFLYGFLPEKNYKGCEVIQEKVTSKKYLVTLFDLANYEKVNINPKNLDYLKSDLVLPEKIKNYNVYLLGTTQEYSGRSGNIDLYNTLEIIKSKNIAYDSTKTK